MEIQDHSCMEAEDEAKMKEDLLRVRNLLMKKVVSVKGVSFVKGQSGDLASSWKQAFLQHTNGGSGVLTFDDLRKLVRNSLKIGMKVVSDDTLEKLFEDIDSNRNGTVDFVEFLTYLQQRPETEEHKILSGRATESVVIKMSIALKRMRIHKEVDVIELFSKVDRNTDNTVSMHEMRRFLREIVGVTTREISDSDLRVLFNNLDADRSGHLDQREFVTFITAVAQMRIKPMPPSWARQDPDARDPSMAKSSSSPVMASGNAVVELPKVGVKSETMTKLSQTLSPSRRRKHRLPPVQERAGAYFTIQGSQHLNRIENRLCQAGVDVRGKLFDPDFTGPYANLMSKR